MNEVIDKQATIEAIREKMDYRSVKQLNADVTLGLLAAIGVVDKMPEVELCGESGDCVDRQMAIDTAIKVLKRMAEYEKDERVLGALDYAGEEIMYAITDLPTVKPELTKEG